MPTLDDYLNGMQQRQQKAALLESNLGDAANTNPDEFANMVKLSRASSIAVDAVPEYQDIAKSTQLLKKTNVPELVDTHPKTSQFLSDPNKAKLASDDIDNFKETEGVFGKIGNFFDATGGVIKSGVLSANAGIVGLVRAPIDALNDAAGVILPVRPFTPLTNALAEYQKGISREAQAALPKAEGDLEKGVVSGGVSLVRNTLNLPLLFAGPQGQRAYFAATLAPVFGEEYGQAKEKGLSTAQAITYGGSQAAIEYATEKIPVSKLVGDLKAGSPFYKTLYNQLLTEIPGEQAATLLQDLNQWAALNPEKPFKTYIEERPSAALQTLVATTVGVGGSTVISTGLEKATNAYADKADAAQRADGIASVIENMNKLSAANKVRTRDADTFEEWINQVSEDSPIQNVYINAETLKQSGLDKQLQEVAPELAEQVETAAAMGRDIQIPISEYMTKIAPTPLGDAMLDNLRAEGETMTRKEAREFVELKSEELQAAAEQLMVQKENDQKFIDSARQVETTMFDQIKSTGAYTSATSRNFATYVRDIYVTKAAAMGITPGELYEMIPYKITSQMPSADVQLFNQDGQVKLDSDAFKTFYGNSVFKDDQGAPVLLYHGTADDVTAFDVDHPNRKDSGWLGTGVYLTDSADMAELYAMQKSRTGTAGENVMPLYARLEKPYYATAEDKARVKAGGREAADQFTADLQAQGYDGVIYQVAPDAKEIVIFDPAAVKSQFNDGTWSNENNLLSQKAKGQTPGKPVPTTLDELANVDAAFKFAASQTFATNRDFKVALQDRVLSAAKAAKIDLGDFTEGVEQYLVRVALADAVTALETNPNAVGWYNEKVTKALRLVSLIHPEINTDPQAKFAFTWALAVTSNGLKVDKNFELAERAYAAYKETGKMPTNMQAGQAQIAINESLGMFNDLIEKYGFETVEKFMTTKQTVKQVVEFTGKNVSGENLTTEVYGAAALGPKIGNGFFANLYGHFEQLTMDRWLMRTWGRWTGTLLDDNKANIKIKQSQLKSTIQAMSAADKKAFEAIIKTKLATTKLNEVAEAIEKASMKPENRRQMAMIGALDDASRGKLDEIFGAAKKGQLRVSMGDELRKVGNSLAKYMDGQKEAPSGPPERARIRKVMAQALTNLQQQFPSLTMSDLQALLWYPEKRLYDSAKTAEEGATGYEDNEAPDYANAAAALAKEKGVSEEVINQTIEDVDNELSAIAAERAAGAERNIRDSVLRQGTGEQTGDTSGILNQLTVAPTFYSQLANTFSEAKQQSMPADQWVNWLNSNASKFGIKKEEIEFSGIRDYLELNGKEKLTKDEILKYLNGNGVQVQDVILGNRDTSQEEVVRQAFEDEGFELNLDYENGHLGYSENMGYVSRRDLPEYLQEALDTLDNGEETKYSSYTLAGGENYKELLLTLPPQKTVVSEIKFESDEDVENFLTDMSVSGYEGWDYGRVDGSKTVEFNSAIPQVVMSFVMNNNGVITKGKENAGATFASNHWGQQNVLAHIRFNDHKDADGKKVLFVEEIQSDWHQEGRKKGYGKPMLALPANYTTTQDFATSRFLVKDENGVVVGQGKDKKDAEEFTLWKLNKGRIPDAPFKDTKAWAGLAVKRMIRYAAENGYDKVAFVSGTQSAERYDLSKQLDKVVIRKYHDEWVVEGYNGNTETLNRIAKDDADLADTVGKDLADKAIKDNGGSYEGVDLQVGGKGMIKFYDEILPQVVNDTLKKLGGGKVAPMKLQTKDMVPANVGFTYSVSSSAENNDAYVVDAKDNNKVIVGPMSYDDAKAWLYANDPALLTDQLAFDVTDDMRQKSMSGQPLFQGTQDSARGGFDPKTLTTILTKESDYSTFLHETTHFYLDMLTQLASMQNAPPSFQFDLETILEWAGATPQEWNKWNQEFKDTGVMNKGMRKVHEAFAYNSEIYIATGVAPNVKMQNIFDQFATWLRRVYKSIRDELNTIYRQENGEDLPILTGEVRQVMDRMLASEDQIVQAQSVRSMVPLYQTQESSGMDDATWAAYQAMAKESQDQSVADLTAASLRQMRWLSNAKSRIFKEMQKQNAEIRKEVRAQVAKEIEQQPIYRALRLIKFGEQILEDGTTVKVEQNTKLSVAGMQELYMGEGDKYALLDWSSLGYGKYGMLSDEGIHPDVLAERTGFSSGDELVRSLLNAKTLKEAVEEKTDQRMLEEYSDMSDQRSMDLAVERALHNEARARFVAAELRHAAKATQPVRLMLQAARMAARRIIGNKLVRDTKVSEYSAAETRATRAAEKAMREGKPEEVTKQLQNRLLNNQLTAEATKATQEVDKGIRYLKSVQTDQSRKRVGADYSDQIDQLLSRFDLNNRTLKSIDAQTSLLEWMKSQEDAGYQPEISLTMQNDAYRKNYKNMTVDEFRDLVDAVKQIEHMGRTEQNMLTAAKETAYREARDQIVESINANANGRKVDARTPTTEMGRRLQGMKRFFAAHLKAANVALIMDGGKEGAMWEYFIRTANKRGDQETEMRAKATERLTEIFAPIFKLGKMGGAGLSFPTIGRSLNREARLAIGLNMGNEGNIQRLLDGEGWTREQIQPVLDSLTAQEWQAIQQVWDYFESYRPAISEKERRIYGKEPKWIDPKPLTVNVGNGETLELRGGYYPVKYDPQATIQAESGDEKEAAKRQLQGAFTSTTTRRSFTKARVEKVEGRPLIYTLAGMYSGINDVIHDLAWHEWLIDANKLLRSQSIDQAIRTQYGPEFKQQLKTWVQDVAAGEQAVQNEGEIALNYLRQSISAAGLGFNVMSALQQITGFNQSIVKVGARYIGRGIAQTISDPRDAMKMVNEKSSFMANRARTQFRELNELRNMVQDESAAMRQVKLGAYFMMSKMQRMVDVPTWIGAYEKAIGEGNDESRSIALADQAVIDSQGGGMLKDLSRVERGGAGLKLFTVYYSYMNTVMNLATVKTMTAKSKGRLAADYAMLFVVPVVLTTALKQALTPGGDDEWDMEKLARKLAAEQLSYLMGTMIILREFGQAGQIMFGNDKARDYSGPAGLRVVADAVSFLKQASQLEFDDSFRKAAINLLGDVTGLPSAQINRTITGTKALVEGKTENPAAIVLGKEK